MHRGRKKTEPILQTRWRMAMAMTMEPSMREEGQWVQDKSGE